eukprot:TRINITY_DN22104_c0_g1_i3.p1 TRINITY_DN22104_c0_g1~~TRINITY_DN22104_c0_g1_i3.p1  ORF type:complete len:292 (-),score=23.17 TRINITY_DN22104_c0_g1_i3:271-1095(-)
MLKLLVSLTLLFSCTALLKVGITEYFSDQAPHFVNFTEDGDCQGAFECDIVQEICTALDEECEIVKLPDLETRISYVENGTVDFSISQTSVSLERAERVHFVRPYYYYAGALIYVLDTLPISEHPDWEDISGSTVCTLKDYYASEAIKLRYEVTILDIGTSVDNVLDGLCDYAITDSTEIIAGMVPSAVALAEFGAPYGIATSHAARDTLGAKISDVMIGMMNEGPDSKILLYEDIHLVPLGFPKNQKLADVVTAITEAGGPISGPAEDAIWDE